MADTRGLDKFDSKLSPTAMFALRSRAVAAARFYSTPTAAVAQVVPKSVDSSTSASDYKLAHPRRRPPALPTTEPAAWTAEQAVTSIIYNSAHPLAAVKKH